uniref:G protein subunit beta 1 like n=1 Tax=Bos taurus TaxID=9913 RepID=A0A3Q1MAU3_BOVIN
MVTGVAGGFLTTEPPGKPGRRRLLQQSKHADGKRAHGSPRAQPPVRPTRCPLGCARAALLPRSPGTPAAPLGVAAWAGARLEPADAEATRRPGWPRGPVCDLAAHTAPGTPAAQGRDLQLCVWDLAEGRNAVVDAVHLESVGFCRASVLAEGPQRWMLAVPGRGSDEVQVLELPSKTSVSCLKPEAGARLGMPMCLQLWQAESSPRPLLLAGYEDGSLALWDVSARKVCSRVACHSEPVMALALDPRRARGVSGSAEKVLAVWSLEGQQALQVRGTHELINPGIADLKIRPDSKILATAGWDHRVRVFQWRTMKPLAVLAFHSATVHCVAFNTTGLLAAGSGDQRISVWSLYPPT